MKPNLAAIPVLIVSCAPAFALIGEDAKQIEDRYGKVKQILDERGNYRELGYDYRGFMLVVDFIDGVSQREGFARPDKSNLSGNDIKAILAFSADKGQMWRDLPSKNGDRFWMRSDGKALAVFPADGNFFFVQDVKFVQPE